MTDNAQASPTTTTELLNRMKSGDARAGDSLFRRLLPRLARWTSRRLPSHAREHLDTADIVQDTLLRSLEPLHRFESRGDGAIDAYLRAIATNRIRDEIRKAARRPVRQTLEDRAVADSPLDAAITAEEHARYERCLRQLTPRDQAAIAGRLTEELSYQDLATRLGAPTPGAARVAVGRALVRLARAMERDGAQ